MPPGLLCATPGCAGGSPLSQFPRAGVHQDPWEVVRFLTREVVLRRTINGLKDDGKFMVPSVAADKSSGNALFDFGRMDGTATDPETGMPDMNVTSPLLPTAYCLALIQVYWGSPISTRPGSCQLQN